MDDLKPLSWQKRAIIECKGQQSELGCVLIAALGYWPKNPPRYTIRGATISAEGLITAVFENRHSEVQRVVVGPVNDFVGRFNRLGDAIKATDQERIAMFQELQKWIRHDTRADADEGRLG